MDGSLQERGLPKHWAAQECGARGQGGAREQGGAGVSRREFLGAAAGATLLGPGLSSWRRADPQVLVLGVAQDGGMPQTGCYAPRCDRARERDPAIAWRAGRAPWRPAPRRTRRWSRAGRRRWR